MTRTRCHSPEAAARARFPRGLEQPPDSLRFGADALLLAAMAARHGSRPAGLKAASLAVAELGSGCGAALLGLALLCPRATGLGLEREEALTVAAQRNAQALGLDERLRFLTLDLTDKAALRALRHPLCRDAPALNGLDAVLANPPYDVAGRPSPSALRERALRGGASGAREDIADPLAVFCRAGAALLRHQGYFFCIYDARALPRLCAALDAARLGLRRVLPVRARSADPALRVLVEARKNAAHDLRLEAPLTLHPRCAAHAGGGRPQWSARALRFCPWLRP